MDEPEVEPGMRDQATRRVTTWLRSLRKPKRAMIASAAVATFVVILLAIFVGSTRLRMLTVFLVAGEALAWRRYHYRDYMFMAPRKKMSPTARLQRRLAMGEDPVRVWRKHPAAIILEGSWHVPLLGAVVLMVIGLFAISRSPAELIPGFVIGLIIMMILKILVRFPKWRAEVYCLTPKRLIMTRGIFTHREPFVPLAKFVNRESITPWHSHMFHTLGLIRVPYGTMNEETAGPNADTKTSLDHISFIPNIEAMMTELIDLEFGENAETPDPES